MSNTASKPNLKKSILGLNFNKGLKSKVSKYMEAEKMRSEEGLDFLPEKWQAYTKADWQDRQDLEQHCSICEVGFKKMSSDRSRHHCRRCGKAVCSTCFKNKKKISKNDPTEYEICDKCDFEIANPNLKDWLRKIKDQQQFTRAEIDNDYKKYELEVKQQRKILRDLDKSLDEKKQNCINMQIEIQKEQK